jgi:hypothetical protein
VRRDNELEHLVQLIAENIDRLINLDVSGYGVIGDIYRAARAHHGEPLTLLAARRLRQALSPGDYFFVTSGWLMPGFYPYGETDGPIGAATLGRALGIGLDARMVVVTEDRMVPITVATCRAAGLNVMSEEDLRQAPRPPHPKNLYCLVVPFPIDEQAGRKEAERLFDNYRPKAMVAIEKNGPNRQGVYSMIDGSDNDDCVIKAGLLFDEAKRRGALTIGIGDRGNEIGFGATHEVPRRVLPFGENATDNTTVDVLVTAAVSNWGASGIAAALAADLDRRQVMHDTATESRMLHRCIDAGGVDGFSCRPVAVSDGMVEAVHVGVAALLNELVRAPAAREPAVFSTPVIRKPR